MENNTITLIQSSQLSLVGLPYEIIDIITRYLNGPEIKALGQVNRHLAGLVTVNDSIWRRQCQKSLGDVSCKPYSTYREMYYNMGRYLWLGNGDIWHGDNDCFGSMVVSAYSADRGLELYELICGREPVENEERSIEDDQFRPYLRRSLIFPLPLFPNPSHPLSWISPRGLCYELIRALDMPFNRRKSFMSLWPPLNIPSRDRTRRHPVNNGGPHQDSPDFQSPPTPAPWALASPTLLRINRSITRATPDTSPAGHRRLSIGHRIETYSKLSPELYTPTCHCPWRGIWVGDYGIHGGEFILLHQPTPDRLEAVKLTGDMNVPRGELSFVVDDLAHYIEGVRYNGYPGRVVEAQGQVAEVDFVNSRFLDTHLILVSEDELVHYWKRLDRFMCLYRIRVDGNGHRDY